MSDFTERAPALPDDPGADINLSAFERLFNEPFDDLDVAARGCQTRWIAHTPWNGDFGDARFTDPSPGFPFVVHNGLLRIEARKAADGQWRSGLLSSGNDCNGGFALAEGYFEMRAKLPKGEGLWPAFWLVSRDRSGYSAEIDIMEHIGAAPTLFSSTLHIHPDDASVQRFMRNRFHTVPPGSLYDRYNTFGVELTRGEAVFYFNRREIWRTALDDRFQRPMTILVNLAMGSGYPIENAPDPSYLYIDYIRAYQRKVDAVVSAASPKSPQVRQSISRTANRLVN